MCEWSGQSKPVHRRKEDLGGAALVCPLAEAWNFFSEHKGERGFRQKSKESLYTVFVRPALVTLRQSMTQVEKRDSA